MSSSKDLKSLFRQKLGGSQVIKSNTCSKHGIILCKPCANIDEVIKNDLSRKRKLKEIISNDKPKKSILVKKTEIPENTSKPTENKTVERKSVKFVENMSKEDEDIREEPEENTEEKSDEKLPNDVTSIPEGFFDDPVVELKTRKVVPKSKLDEDYELFLKSIEAISKENEEQREHESQNDTVKLQIVENISESHKWNSMNQLINEVEEVKKIRPISSQNATVEFSDSSDDDEFTEDIVWRKKSNR